MMWLCSVQGIEAQQSTPTPLPALLTPNIPDQRDYLLDDVKIIISEQPFEESEIYYYFDFDDPLPPGTRFNEKNNSIEGKLTKLGTYTVKLFALSQAGEVETTFEWVVEMPPLTPPNEQLSVARQWNEVLLAAIRDDLARPTVHARNLHHVSSAMYDAWAMYDGLARPYLVNHGNEIDVDWRGCSLDMDVVARMTADMSAAELASARHETISYAAYRLLSHRFDNSPGHVLSQARFDLLLESLGYDENDEDVDGVEGALTPVILGNFIGDCYVRFGREDGANEQNDYANRYYTPANPPLATDSFSFAQLDTMLAERPVDPNRWQPLAFEVFIDQSDNLVLNAVTEFQGAEWGNVAPFALNGNLQTVYERDGEMYSVYHDPGSPPYIEQGDMGVLVENEYAWGFTLVPIWASYLDPTDGVKIDISPASIGNNAQYPTSGSEYDMFYSVDGGDNSPGHQLNPHTEQPYEPNEALRGDYGRVIAEFWADGPDSETPPGHWFTFLNEVGDHPDFEKRYQGEDAILDDLEWDIKAYFVLGGAMHDAAVSAWSIKGWYDYVRPISAIRTMAEQGQSDPSLPNYSSFGLPLRPGLIELVDEDDELAGENGENVNKVKLYTWRGHDYIRHEETDVAGVGWVLAEDWWPYQRPTFVTPPFAGYVSGHSAFSRAAAETLTRLTGDPYFPGGMSEFVAPKDEFLVFEDGPSEDVVLQWATYRDAADQSAMSRIWGGIHPPADDIPGRLIGRKVGIDAFNHANHYFEGELPDNPPPTPTFPPIPALVSTSTPSPFAFSEAGEPGNLILPTAGLLIVVMIIFPLALWFGRRIVLN